MSEPDDDDDYTVIDDACGEFENITDEEWEAAKAAERREHAIGRGDYLRDRAKDGDL